MDAAAVSEVTRVSSAAMVTEVIVSSWALEEVVELEVG